MKAAFKCPSCQDPHVEVIKTHRIPGTRIATGCLDLACACGDNWRIHVTMRKVDLEGGMDRHSDDDAKGPSRPRNRGSGHRPNR